MKRCYELKERRKSALQCAVEVPPPPQTPYGAVLGLGFTLLGDGNFRDACSTLTQLIHQNVVKRNDRHPRCKAILCTLLSLAFGMGYYRRIEIAVKYAHRAIKDLEDRRLSSPLV